MGTENNFHSKTKLKVVSFILEVIHGSKNHLLNNLFSVNDCYAQFLYISCNTVPTTVCFIDRGARVCVWQLWQRAGQWLFVPPNHVWQCRVSEEWLWLRLWLPQVSHHWHLCRSVYQASLKVGLVPENTLSLMLWWPYN